MGFLFVRTAATKAGNCTVVYDVPAEVAMTRNGDELIASSTGCRHISQLPLVQAMFQAGKKASDGLKVKRYLGDDLVIEVA